MGWKDLEMRLDQTCSAIEKLFMYKLCATPGCLLFISNIPNTQIPAESLNPHCPSIGRALRRNWGPRMAL